MVINSVPHGERIICGHNPWLYARRVTELCVRQEPETGFEVIEWTEPQTFRWKDERKMGFEVAAQGLRKEVRRSMQGPLHNGLVWDRLLNAPKPGYENAISACESGILT